MSRSNQSFDHAEQAVNSQSKRRGWKRARKYHARIREGEARDDRLAQTSGANEGRECRGSNRDHSGRAYSGHYHWSS